ncbi:hypothetical protein HPB48_017639 [Haemaphysalis longicornis]|uniref:XK-related protein n=1 Tax=Haemaphysalis longicornis TaxID=44386 RepID=A0A9J6FNY3_HAELO|nr:hypothetical protein HPB48_017639 [Haemaphysalis longicornis]
MPHWSLQDMNLNALPVVRFAVKAQYMSIGTSMGSVAYSLVCYRKSMALMFLDKGDIFWRDTLAHFLWRLLEVGPRVVALGAFASLFPWSIGGLFILRGLIVVVWILLMAKEHHVENGYAEVWGLGEGSTEVQQRIIRGGSGVQGKNKNWGRQNGLGVAMRREIGLYSSRSHSWKFFYT